ncbi:MAG TPA: glycerophosphoryl diester phosphodiesterase [Stellaceae bacterium]|nr:glycerophosphoryl diester phosphodiesterase [Stellaceae bacterium]
MLEGLELPPVIGHRGAAAHAPENTLAGFRAARALGCGWVEFDVRLTADGMPVICHDDRLDRTSNGRGRISRLPLAALSALDAGSWFGPAFAGETIPTLEAALDCCRVLGLGANVEIKAEHRLERATAEAVAAVLARSAGSLPPVLISSFLPEAVAAAAALAPAVPRGMLFRRIPADWAAIAEELGCATIHAGERELDAGVAREVVAAGYPLLAYTVNDAARARQLFGWGVASVFSDAPDIISPMADRTAAGEPSGARRGAST